MEYRRSNVPGGTFFLTIVTHRRRPILVRPRARPLLRQAFRDVRSRHPFAVEAIVLLPDHLHLLVRLPAGDAGLSIRGGGIKRRFTQLCLAAGLQEAPTSDGQKAKRYRGIWQMRWEHTIRDAEDFKRHLDYIHANPLNHGLAARVRDWPWSSFHRYVRMGEYDPAWAGHVELPDAAEYFWAD